MTMMILMMDKAGVLQWVACKIKSPSWLQYQLGRKEINYEKQNYYIKGYNCSLRKEVLVRNN